MVKLSRSAFEHGNLTLASTSKAYLVARVYGGESVHIKAHIDNSGIVYIGSDQSLTTGTGYQMDGGESIDIGHDITFGRSHYIEVWALAASASDVLTFFKVIQNAEVQPEVKAG